LLNVLDGAGEVHIHAHFAHDPTAAAYLAHRMAGVPFSFTAHAKDLYTTPVAQLREQARAATFVATCTEANRRYLEQVVGVAPDRVRMCRHGVDLDRFGTIQRRPVPGRILAIGRLVPKKGFDVLIRACRLLADKGVSFDCRIIGNGPLRDELVGLTREVRLSEQVHIQPGGPQIELLEAYAEAELFVLAPLVQANGDRDGMPNVIQEALAAGIPVVTSAISGIPEVVRDGINGRLVEPGDPAALADALEELLGNPDLRAGLGHAAANLAADELELSSCVQPLAEEFRLALARAGHRLELSGTGSRGSQ
jgi:glycosyltransferase involved in cell wall biosynthesis